MPVITIRESTITCPNCGHQKTEEMPTDACQFFYECENCKTVLHPNPGDCCAFCSYGTVKCPSKQEEDFLSGKNEINDKS
ncbi:MAG: GDCCVxC domain-containing (seleno)protein [Bacteroidota bacterium]|nr:GDCCVxC domain-containing (seleno)protein [Bacteroidota bacterium]